MVKQLPKNRAPLAERPCPICRCAFVPRNSRQKVCGFACAIEHAQRREANKRRVEEKRRRIELRAYREQSKSVGVLTREAQSAFNKYIRTRDEGKPCISCGATDPPWTIGGQWDCGHFLSVGSHPELRFEELNAHRQCKKCNGGAGFSWGGAKQRTVSQEYRPRLIERIGLEKVLWLEGPHEPKNYRADDLRAIKKDYQAKTRELTRCCVRPVL